MLPKRNRVFVRQKYNLPFAKIMRTSTKLSDCAGASRPFLIRLILAPFQGASLGGVPRVETLSFIHNSEKRPRHRVFRPRDRLEAYPTLLPGVSNDDSSAPDGVTS
jgi:hypothetical protein